MKISAVVITKNEEHNIEGCLETLKWADEIIVVDSDSTDRTREIVSAYTKNIFTVNTDVFSEKRIFSLGKTRNDWILFLDADERLTKELIDEIQSLQPAEDVHGYRIGRRNYFMGKPLGYSGVYPDKHIRLFNRKFAAITPRVVHEGVEVKGTVKELKAEFDHYTNNSLEQMISKINLYSTLEAGENYEKKKHITKAGVFTHAVSSFLRVFISRRGYKDGLGGFFTGFSYSMVSFLSHLKLLKLQGKL